MTKTIWRIAAVLLLAQGCNGIGGGISPAGPVPIEDFSEVGADVVCTQRAECCPSLFETRQEQIDRCRGTVVPITDSVVEDVQASIDAARAAYDASIAGDCLRRIEARGCRAVPADDPYGEGCEEAFLPLVMEGGACTEDFECLTGDCEITSPGEDGTCVVRPVEGEACGTGDCDDGLYCPSSSRMCVPKREDGSTCDSDRQCLSDTCDEGSCAANTICN
jgi:hypothetical protein